MKTPKYHEHFGPVDGSFDKLPDDAKKRVQAIVAQFTVQNGKKQRDGSKGFVRISPKQLQDLLVWFTNGMIEQTLVAMDINVVHDDDVVHDERTELRNERLDAYKNKAAAALDKHISANNKDAIPHEYDFLIIEDQEEIRKKIAARATGWVMFSPREFSEYNALLKEELRS